jgi:hypothetical protein
MIQCGKFLEAEREGNNLKQTWEKVFLCKIEQVDVNSFPQTLDCGIRFSACTLPRSQCIRQTCDFLERRGLCRFKSRPSAATANIKG